MDEKEISDFESLCKEVLLPGGYVVILLLFYSYAEPYQSFKRLDLMSCRTHMYSCTIRNRFRIGIYLFSIRTPHCLKLFFTFLGHQKHQKFNAPIHLENCSNVRNLAGMFRVKDTKSHLWHPESKVVFNSNKLSVDMLCELVDLFCPQSVTFMDPYCRPMTTLIAAPNWEATRGDQKNYDVFTAALHSLRGFLTSTTHPESTPGVPTKDSSIVMFE